jgi:hypothetical protein
MMTEREPYQYLEQSKLTQYMSVIGEMAPDAPEELRYRMRKIEENTFVTDGQVETQIFYVTQADFERHMTVFNHFKKLMESVCELTTDRIQRTELQGRILKELGGL